MDKKTCPLCHYHEGTLFFSDGIHDYYRCAVCSLVHVPEDQFLSLEDERKRYDLHQNSEADDGYRAYLERLSRPVLERINPGSKGLDFGCGPEPVLAGLFSKAGHGMAVYDLFYRPDDAVLDEHYDFITASEVVEHVRNPGQEFDRLWHCLEPGGILGIMTQWIVRPETFSKWHYKNDRTHICFYSPETFSWLSRHWRAEIVFPERDVVLFLKTGSRIVNCKS